MATKSIECQIATSQIGRYLSGDPFSPEALKQLEAHVAECPECKASLVQRRAILQAMLGGPTAVAEVEDVPETPRNVAGALHELLGAKKPRPAPVAQIETTPKAQASHFWKPFGYSLALGAVLVAMRVYSKPFGNTVFSDQTVPVSDAKAPDAKTAPPTPATPLAAPVTATPAAVTAPTAPAATGSAAQATAPALRAASMTTPQSQAPEAKPAVNVTQAPAPTNSSSAQSDKIQASKPEAKSEAAETVHETPPTPAPVFTLPNEPTPRHGRHARKAKAKAKAAKTAKHKAHHKKSHRAAAEPTAIRVYDPSGNLISK